jgi:dGTPase
MAEASTDMHGDLALRAPGFKPNNKPQAPGVSPAGRDVREPYQRDLGRVIHSASFRRLQAKTQVMGTGEGDFHRTRLTHSLEVGQIGRGIVWNLMARIGEAHAEWLPPAELMEAISYAHDLGHPPFGHGGERALHKQMRDMGGFEGNAQTLRIITRLEHYYRNEGIRPTRRLLLGVLKYPVAYSEYPAEATVTKPPKCFYDEDIPLVERALEVFAADDRRLFRSLCPSGKPAYRTFDCSIMELADDIAYGVHDLEDGIGRGILRREQAGEEILRGFYEAGIPKIYSMTAEEAVKRLFSNDVCDRKLVISGLVGFFVENIGIRERGAFAHPLLDLQAFVPDHIRLLLDHLSRKITFDNIVRSRHIQTLEYKGEKIIADLFRAFCEEPLSLLGLSTVDPYNGGAGALLETCSRDKRHWTELDAAGCQTVARTICDVIASMTNPYAEKYHRRLFEPGFGSSTDEL